MLPKVPNPFLHRGNRILSVITENVNFYEVGPSCPESQRMENNSLRNIGKVSKSKIIP